MDETDQLIADEEARHAHAHSVDADRLAGIAARARAEADETEHELGPDDPEPERVGDEEDTEATSEPAMIVCPFCGTGEVEADQALEHLGRVTAIVQPFVDSPDETTCPSCQGWGTVFTGSKLPEQSITPCKKCNGAGYIARSLVDELPVQQAPVQPLEFDLPGDFVDPMTLAPDRGGEPPAVGMDWNPQTGRWAYPARV